MFRMRDDGSVAKRTRSKVSRRIQKRKHRTRELHQEFRLDYNNLMLSHDATHLLMFFVTNRVRMMREHVMRPKCSHRSQMFKVEHKLKELSDRLKIVENKLFHTKLIMDNVLVEKLHTNDCTESDECILRMQSVLKQDPLSLERKQEFFSAIFGSHNMNVYHRCSPLHHAVMLGHVKCAKFLLERGAKITTLTTKGDTLLQTLYDPSLDCFDWNRQEILELLLEYGVSNMFHYNYSGECALNMACIKTVEEVSLLLHHGATMNKDISREAISDAWIMFELPILTELLLRHPKRLNFGPGSHTLCNELIKHCYWKMVLPGVPLDMCHKILLESLQIYKVFGGKFRVCPKKDPSQDLMQYLKSYKHRRHFNGAKLRIKELISNPMSLQEISRLVVRKCIRKNYDENIKKLEVPKTLQSFLGFHDIIITELPEEFDKFGDDTYPSSGGEDEDSSSDMEL